jgi:hypothetical protein
MAPAGKRPRRRVGKHAQHGPFVHEISYFGKIDARWDIGRTLIPNYGLYLFRRPDAVVLGQGKGKMAPGCIFGQMGNLLARELLLEHGGDSPGPEKPVDLLDPLGSKQSSPSPGKGLSNGSSKIQVFKKFQGKIAEKVQGSCKERTFKSNGNFYPWYNLYSMALSSPKGRPYPINGVMVGDSKGRNTRLFSGKNKVMGRKVSIGKSGVVVQICVKSAFHVYLLFSRELPDLGINYATLLIILKRIFYQCPFLL